MTLGLKTQVKLRPQVTAQLTQTMAFLELPLAELEARITAELAENPALELVIGGRCLNCGRPLRKAQCPVCRTAAMSTGPIVHVVDRPSFSADLEQRDEVELCTPETLAEYLLRQVVVAVDDTERSIAAYILAQLDDRGFLIESPAEIAHHLQQPVERVLAILRLIQHADPPGVGARTVQESLLLQLESLDDEGHGHVLAGRLIAAYWELLGTNHLKHAARDLHVTQSEIESALDFIQLNLTPFPAQVFWHSRRGLAVKGDLSIQRPDALIYQTLEEGTHPLRVEVISPVTGWLQVNTDLMGALEQCDPVDRERLQSSVDRAQLIARSVRQRNQTLCRLLRVIVQEQAPYLLGNELYPRPLKRAQLAGQLGLHESTISRALANKAVALPNGRVIQLAEFFDQNLAIRKAVKAIIDGEPQPLSDGQIVQRLAEQGLRVGRRTVCKYRMMEGIRTSNKRT